MRARINTAIGRHWGSVVRAIDVIYVLTAFGVLGGLPPLLNVVTKSVRSAMTSLRGSQARLATLECDSADCTESAGDVAVALSARRIVRVRTSERAGATDDAHV
jgi:hypothetical protein